MTLQDLHTAKVSIQVSAPAGTNIVIPAQTNAWIYIHELIGDMTANGTLVIECGTRVQGVFTLDAGQGLTEQDEPGMDGVPRFMCRPGEDFVLKPTGGTFQGSCDYSYRY
jgi:hypothetical protein